jgi:predicted 3-demethylubiquinone-9 3-methyltransferase (glyoxalase superfamily)
MQNAYSVDQNTPFSEQRSIKGIEMATIHQKIVTHLWFNTEAKKAANFYCSVFPESIITTVRTLHDTPSGDSDVVSFTIFNQSFIGISAGPLFKFNESVSFIVYRDTQYEEAGYCNLTKYLQWELGKK